MGSALSDARHQCIIAKKPFFRQGNDLRGLKDDRTVRFAMGQVTIVHGQLAQIHSPPSLHTDNSYFAHDPYCISWALPARGFCPLWDSTMSRNGRNIGRCMQGRFEDSLGAATLWRCVHRMERRRRAIDVPLKDSGMHRSGSERQP